MEQEPVLINCILDGRKVGDSFDRLFVGNYTPVLVNYSIIPNEKLLKIIEGGLCNEDLTFLISSLRERIESTTQEDLSLSNMNTLKYETFTNN